MHRVQGSFIHGHLDDELAHSQKRSLPVSMHVTVILNANNWKYPNANTRDRVSESGVLQPAVRRGYEHAYAVFHFLRREGWGPVSSFLEKLSSYTLTLPFRTKASTSPSVPAPVLLVCPGQGSVAEPFYPCPPPPQ